MSRKERTVAPRGGTPRLRLDVVVREHPPASSTLLLRSECYECNEWAVPRWAVFAGNLAREPERSRGGYLELGATAGHHASRRREKLREKKPALGCGSSRRPILDRRAPRQFKSACWRRVVRCMIGVLVGGW
jgi:hypothetical protein